MAITVLGQDTFGWLTNPTLLAGNRWASASMASIGSPGPYGTGFYARTAGSSFMDTFAFPSAGLVFIEFSVRFASFGGTDIVQLHQSSSGVMASLGVEAGGQIYLTGFPGGPNIPFPANMTTGNWYRIQYNFKCGLGTSGHALVKVNGNLVGDYSGNFSFFGNVTPITFIRLRCGTLANTDFSNVVYGFITDPVTDWFPLDQRAVCLRAAANASVAWTPNGAATNADCINDSDPDSDTTYNSSAVSGDQDLFSVTPPGLTGTINLVSSVTIARKDDAGPDFITPSIRTNGTTVQGASVGQGSSYQGFSAAWQLNPVTGVAFTPAEINAIQFGYRNAT